MIKELNDICKKSRWILRILFLGTFCAFALLGFTQGAEPIEQEAKPLKPDTILKGFKVDVTKGSWVRQTITADEAHMFTPRNKIQLFKLHVDFYDTDGQIESTLDSTSGFYYTGPSEYQESLRERGDIDLMGNEEQPVLWKRPDGSYAIAPHIYHQGASHTLNSSDTFYINIYKDKQAFTMDGQQSEGFQADIRMKKWRFFGESSLKGDEKPASAGILKDIDYPKLGIRDESVAQPPLGPPKQSDGGLAVQDTK